MGVIIYRVIQENIKGVIEGHTRSLDIARVGIAYIARYKALGHMLSQTNMEPHIVPV